MDKYNYAEMSNKVLRPDKPPGLDDPALPQSLAGQISKYDMGRSVQHEAPQPDERAAAPPQRPSLYVPESFEGVSYTPTSEEAGHILELIMAEVHRYLPDASHAVVVSAADVVVEILKSDGSNVTKRKEIDELLGQPIDDVLFNELVGLAKRINDYHVEDHEDETEGVAIVFDEEQDEEPEEPEEEPQPIEEGEQIQNEVVLLAPPPQDASQVPLSEIDLLYVQCQVTAVLGDASQAADIGAKMVAHLQNAELLVRDLENELMELLDYNHFELVKKLVQNRWRIAYQIELLEATDKEPVYAKIEAAGLLHEFRPKRRLSDEATESSKKAKVAREPRIVDLDALTFTQGPQLMASTKIKLPKGSYQQNKKLYDLISVPPPPPPPSLEENNERLVAISELPEWARAAFPAGETATLNRVQSRIYPAAFQSDENLLLCAPTGAGKTNVAMLTVLRQLETVRDDGKLNLRNFRVVYIAPLKALVQEQMREFQRRLTSFGVVVRELTGDATLSKAEFDETNILVTTPEKWDIVSRKAADVSALAQLVIIDEIHLLHDERGPVLESIVARTLRLTEVSGPVRLVGLSATLPNYQDVATFLRVDFKKGLFFFDSSYRPCPLEQQFIGIKEKKAIKKVNAMNEACFDKVVESLQNHHQLIIFVHLRKDTYKTAKWLKEKLAESGNELLLNMNDGTKEILRQEAEAMGSRDLQEVVPSGFGIHHAGLNRDERSVVEDLFAQGHLQVLCSTATLAWGVNLPAHTVVIKGTETYSPEKGAWVQLLPQDILQMLGRAGRPRYDKSGVGVIITSQDDIQYYLAVLNQQLPIESQLMSKLVDSVNAEVVRGISSRDHAVMWLAYSYLYVRMLRLPQLYLVGPEYKDDHALFNKRTDLVHSALVILHKHNMVVYDEATGAVKPTELGKIASHFYINYPTVNMFNTKLKPWLSEVDLLRVFSGAGEFKFVPVRQEEKFEISKLLDRCPFPVKEPPTDPLAKVNLLLQAYISKLSLDGFALVADLVYITQSAGRLLRAIHEIALKKNWALVARKTLDLCKMVERRMWLSSSPFRQFPDAPKEVVRASENAHLPFDSYFSLNASELAEAINFRGHSQLAYNLLQQFPRLSVTYLAQPITPTLIRVQLEVVPEFTWNPAYHGGAERFLLLVEDCDGDTILYSDLFVVYRGNSHKEHVVDLTVPVTDPMQPNYHILLISEKWLHLEVRVPLVLYDTKLPKKFPPHTPMLDLQRTPVSALDNDDFVELFDFDYFNKAQTQVFPVLWESNDNTFIGVTKGSGKTVLAELALLNHFRQNKGRAVYLHPNQTVIDTLAKTWTKKFAFAERQIAKLTGDRLIDTTLVGKNHVVLATPEQFDAVSRRWKQRKAVRAIELIVADDAHGVAVSAAYETVLARMRYVSGQTGISLRIVALSTPLANGRDFGEWLGCSRDNIFNFDPTYRSHAIREIKIQAPPVDTQIATTYNYIKLHRSVVFVPSRSECVAVATELLVRAQSDKWTLLRIDLHTIRAYLDRLEDPTVRELLENGIGLLYDAMPTVDRLVVEKLFDNNYLTVLVAAQDTAEYAPSAHTVVVHGTSSYDGSELRHVDYPIHTLLEMVGSSRDQVLVLTSHAKMPYYTKFLGEALPLESQYLGHVHDSFMNEISSGTFNSKQGCVDWLTFTYFYRRLQMNPSFYDVKDTTALGVSEYLSELVETTMDELEEANLVEVDDDDDENPLAPLNGAVIASHYNVSYHTMKVLGTLDDKSRLKQLLETVCQAVEVEVPIRPSDEHQLRKVYNRVPLKATNVDYTLPSFKAFVLLQAHLSRLPLSVDLATDQKLVLRRVLDVVNACVDTLSSEGYLNAVHAMDISQMVVQGVWNRDSALKQLPYVDEAMLQRAAKYNVETVFDIMSLEDDERLDVLQLSDEKLNKVAEFVNKYPNIDMSYEISKEVQANEPATINITLERDEELDDLSVVSAHYPFPKTESWWVVVGDNKSKQLYGIKKTQIAKEHQQVEVEFTVPAAGTHELSVWAMCDSYLEVDKEVEFTVEVK